MLCMMQTVAVAQASEYLVTPLALNLDVNKRDIVEQTVTLINNDTRMVRLYAAVNEVSVDGSGIVQGFQSPSQVDRTSTPTAWFEISRQRIELAPGERREIPFTIRMNPNTEPGEYSVFLGFAEGSNAPTAQAKVAAGKAPGTLVSLTVDKEQNAFLRLEKFIVDRFVTKEEGGGMSFILSNPGRVDVLPKGEVIFYDNSGDEVAALPVNPEDITVDAQGQGAYTMNVPEGLGIGKYKAFLSVEYGEFLTASVHDTAFFYILPLKQLIALFIILMIFAIFIALYVHKRFDTVVEGAEYDSVPLHIRENRSTDKDHDIDLKKNDT